MKDHLPELNQEEEQSHEFVVSAVHVLPQCDGLLRKGLQEEYYFLNDRCCLSNGKVVLNDSALPHDFFGKRINVQAMSACYGLNSTKADVVACMSSHLSLDEKDIHKEPLTKLRQDTIKQMKEGGVV